MGDTKFPISFVKLNNYNYSIWKYKMELLLIKECVWEAVMAKEPSDEENDSNDGNSTATTVVLSAAAIRKLGNKARALIGLMVEDDQLHYIRNETTALGSWNALKEHHEKHTLSNKVHLIRLICKLNLEENGDVQKHMNQLDELFQKLRDINENELSESWNVAMLLSSLPKQYDTLITALEAREEKDLTYAFVQQKILAEFDIVLKVSVKGQKLEVPWQRHQLDFYFCKKEGHFKRDCEQYKAWLVKHVEKQHERERKSDQSRYEKDDRCDL